uniref:SH3 domain-containing protein n=1 Tax=Esox lucius TaxID=8010 RepID=A0A6Q2WSD5_ESOLU
MQVDSLINATRQPSGSERTEEAFQRCILLQNSVEETTRKLKTLTKAAEPAPVGNYDQRKMEEERRLIRIREQLLALALELSPPQKQEGGSSSTKEDEEEEDSEEIETSDEDIIEDNDDEEDVDAKFTERIPDSGTDTFMVISTFKGEQEGDLTIQTGEVLMILSKNKDGWWLAQDSKGNKGLVPKTYLKVTILSENENEELDDSKRKSWPSTLSKLLDEGISYRGSHFIQPELSQSKLSFKDLFLDPDTGKVRQRAVRTSLTLTLWSCKSIPTPGVGVQVLSRHIRLCAFDGAKVLSNIHTVRATCNSNNVKTWSFSPRMIGILPSLLDGNCFLRCSSDSPELGILFELGVAYIRNSTGERGDLSCGWAFLKLFDANGAPVPYKTYELLVRGGTPYENDVELDPSITRGGINQSACSFPVHQVVFTNLPPCSVSVLPDTLVGSLSTIPLLVLHRQLLADVLLMDRATMQNADLICSPLLATFPEIVDQSDLLDALRVSHHCFQEIRDTDLLMKRFVSVYMENVYPLLYSADLPLPCWADETVENQRARVIFTSLKNTRTLNPSHTNSGHSPPCQKAFDISQITYDLLSMAQ